jgi:hypothetical protein
MLVVARPMPHAGDSSLSYAYGQDEPAGVDMHISTVRRQVSSPIGNLLS